MFERAQSHLKYIVWSVPWTLHEVLLLQKYMCLNATLSILKRIVLLGKLFIDMVGTKKRSCYRKTRKGKGFRGRPKQANTCEIATENTAVGITMEDASSSDETEQLISSSRKKMRLMPRTISSAEETDKDVEESRYRLIDIRNLTSAMSELHECDEGNLSIEESGTGGAGLKSMLMICCQACGKNIQMETSKNITKRGKSYDVNRRAVYHSIESGGGYEGLLSFCAAMNMPCISTNAYYKHLDIILQILVEEAEEEMKGAGQRLRQLMENDADCSIEILDVAVSFDGTWAKRGFTSLIGVFFVISLDTGEVLDYHILSKSCQKCLRKKSQCEDDDAFLEWKREHEASGQCDINYTGSSPGMEAEAASVIWNRSLEKHKMRYKWMVCDGDSKSHSAVENVYGEECIAEKMDCVGHVQKRMGKHLLKLKSTFKDKLADGKSIGGRGRLTEDKIKHLQKYYGLAIRQNSLKNSNPSEEDVNVAVYSMKKNIIAILHHSIKVQDATKQHRFCPRGENSWCKWQQDLATGTSTYKADNCLPEAFFEVLKPTFLNLSNSQLLERCVRGATQNPNECLNSMVWIRCPKHKYHGFKSVQCAVASAVCHFHQGAKCRERIMEKLSVPSGSCSNRTFELKDRKRLSKADKQVSKKEKKKRQAIKLQKTHREEALRETEGVTYMSGNFND